MLCAYGKERKWKITYIILGDKESYFAMNELRDELLALVYC